MKHEWRVVGCAVVTVVGVFLGEHFGPGEGHISVGVAILAAVSMACISFAPNPAGTMSACVRIVCVGIVCAALGSAAMQRSLHGLHDHPLRSAVARHAAVVVRGELVDDPQPLQYGTVALLRVHDAQVSRGSWQTIDRVVLVHANRTTSSALASLAASDRVEGSGDLRILSGADVRYRWRHAIARVDLVSIDWVGSPSGPMWPLANRLRAVVQRGGIVVAARERALLDGFLLGDTRAIDDATTKQFRGAGLSHLLAVSGANVAFVLALAGPLLRRGRLVVRCTLGLAVVAMFAAMTRFEPSVLRASVMAATVMIAQFSGRSVHPMRVLGYAVIGLVLIDPFLVHSVGFELSVGACAGIVLFAGPIARRIPGPRWMRQAISVSIAAQVGVAPILIAVFGAVAWIAPAANLFAVPLAEPITVVGLPATLVSALWPALGRVLLTPVRWMLVGVEVVARVANERPWLLAIGALLSVAVAVVATASPTVDSDA